MSKFKKSDFFIKLKKIFSNRSMSTQLIITIVLIFLSFFALQWLLNDQFFQNYYTQREFSDVHQSLLDYVDNMNEPSADLYDDMYEFTSNKNIYSVVVGRDYRIQNSGYSEYTIEVDDIASGNTYVILVPNNSYPYELENSISIDAYQYSDEVFSPIAINIPGEYTYDGGSNCSFEDCIEINGTISAINKPINLNFQFENNSIVKQELSKLSSGTVDIADHVYEQGYWYTSNGDYQDYLVFIHDLGSFDFIITIAPIENTSNIISIVNSYNNWVYVTAIAIIILWSFRLSTIISKPIQNIEGVAREIADLNFNIEAHEYNNRENTSLSKSINLIAENLKETLNTLSGKNNELTELYDEQVKQVSLKKQLVSSISHELKTPLMIMQVTIQGILDGIIEPQEQEKELFNVLEEINKSSIMIGDMLQIYRLEDANTTLEVSEFNLSEVVMFFINDFENILKKHNLKIDLNLDRNVFIEADLKLIKRCISNFFTNAIRYTPDGEKIYMEVSEMEDYVYFELTNYGTNIKDVDLENIWIPFFRGQSASDTQKIRTRGSGIGLYLVSEILKAHEAEYGIDNVENGVRAYFRINKKTIL